MFSITLKKVTTSTIANSIFDMNIFKKFFVNHKYVSKQKVSI